MLICNIQSFSCPKDGNSTQENEDAFIIPSVEALNDGVFRVASADGATESSFSKEWADLLVNYFYCFQFRSETFFASIYPLIKRHWLTRINAENLPWYAQQKLELGAFASFLGIDINLETGFCSMIAVGDSNAFIFRDGEMQVSFPVKKSEDFGNTPFLVSSELHKNRTEGNFFLEENFELRSGDLMLLGTDAISQWILREVEARNNPTILIQNLFTDANSNDLIENWLSEQRNRNFIKNDDTTLILIQF